MACATIKGDVEAPCSGGKGTIHIPVALLTSRTSYQSWRVDSITGKRSRSQVPSAYLCGAGVTEQRPRIENE